MVAGSCNPVYYSSNGVVGKQFNNCEVEMNDNKRCFERVVQEALMLSIKKFFEKNNCFPNVVILPKSYKYNFDESILECWGVKARYGNINGELLRVDRWTNL